MKKNFIMAIAGGVGIASIIIIVAFYNNQELEKIVIEKPVETKLDNDISKTPVVSGIDEKLDEIEKKANENYYEVPPIEWIKRGPFEIWIIRSSKNNNPFTNNVIYCTNS